MHTIIELRVKKVSECANQTSGLAFSAGRNVFLMREIAGERAFGTATETQITNRARQ